MGANLYVGNLSYNVTSSDLEKLFSQYGTVKSAQVIADKYTGRSKGFGFVEMKSDSEAQAAIQGLNQKLEDRTRALETELKRRDAENAELKQQLNEIKTILRQFAEQKGTQP